MILSIALDIYEVFSRGPWMNGGLPQRELEWFQTHSRAVGPLWDSYRGGSDE